VVLALYYKQCIGESTFGYVVSH